MNSVTPANLAFKLTLTSLVSIILLIMVAVFAILAIGKGSPYLLLLVVIACYSLNYIVLSKVLQKYEKKWHISLKNKGQYQLFKGGSFLKFYLGFVWRAFVLTSVTNPLIDALAQHSNDSLVLGLIGSSLTVYLSFLWLLKFPYGDVSVDFNIQHLSPQQLQAQELPMIEVNEGQRSVDSFFNAVREIFGNSIIGICIFVYFVVGLVQFAAVNDFLSEVWGWWGFFSIIGAGILAYIPVIGGLAGIYTAYTVWGWGMAASILLFAWPLLLLAGVGLFLLLESIFKSMRSVS